MATIFANIPIVETGNGNFTKIDVVCGLRIISGVVDRTNLKYGSEPVGQSYSMPWAYPDAELADLGGPTTIVLTMRALLPDSQSTPVQLSSTLTATTNNGATALAEIETALQALVANVTLNIDTAGLVSNRVRVIPFGGEETFQGAPILVELLGRGPAELSLGVPDPFIADVVLGRALALLDYSDDDPRPRTARIVTAPLPNGTNPWLRFSGLTKIGDLNLAPAISIITVPQENFPAFVPAPWHLNTTKPVGDPADGPVSSHAGIAVFGQVLTAADLNLSDADIATGWILVHDLHYTFHDGFLEIEADLANTSPLAPEFKLNAFGKLRGEIRLKPARFEDRPFSTNVFESALEAEVDLEWDDNPGSDVEDFSPVDAWFEDIVSGQIRNVVETEVNAQIGDQVAPRVIDELRGQLDDQRPNGLFSDESWLEFREQIVAKFFIRFLSAEFFGLRQINNVNVLGGLEVSALAGAYSDNMSLLDLGDSCPGIEIGAGFAGFTGFFALARMRAVVRSEARCSGWHDKYLQHRKELVKIATKNPKLAASVVKTAFQVTPILASPKARLVSDAVKATLKVVEAVMKPASAKLQKDLTLFADMVKRGENATLTELLEIAARIVPPTREMKSESSQSDSPRSGKIKRSKGRPTGKKKNPKLK